METSGLGGGIMLAVAAALWMLYLVPSMLKRRHLSDAERDAKRQEQEGRAIARLERIEAARAVRGVTLAARPEPTPVRPAPTIVRPPSVRTRSRRVRRARALFSLVLFTAIIVVVTQGALVATTGAVAGSWLVLGAALLAGVAALAMLGRLAQAGRPASAARVRIAHPLVDHAPITAPVAEPWTPVAMPKPLYLERTVQAPMVTSDTLAELRAAAAAAELALRRAQLAPEVVPITQPAASRFAAMGVVDEGSLEQTDLDEVLRRRRAVG
ncbi:MAG: hypothetical protein ABJB03_05080 [Rhodoglobus sp.]